MDFSNIPRSIDKNVLDFCKTITQKSNPEFIPLRPEPWCKMNECYDNVSHKVKTCGGKRQLGWRIQIIPDPLPKYLMEAIHHAIWISETGKKIDITPLSVSANQIVFLPDESTIFNEYRIGEKYYALIDCPLVKKYVRLCNLESTEYVNKTKLNEQPNVPKELLAQQSKLQSQIIQKHGNMNNMIQAVMGQLHP